MREITQFAEFTVEIWRRPRQRNMRLTVRPEGHLRVTCNGRRTKREIFSFIGANRPFIAKALQNLEKARQQNPPRQLVSGELFLLRGERRPLQVVWSWQKQSRIRLHESGLEMLAPVGCSSEMRMRTLQNYYRDQARALLDTRLSYWAAQMGRGPKQLVIRGQSTRWGSCSASGQISLNWKLMCAPAEVVDYVIIHELAHLHHMDHSPRFWALVERFFPHWRGAKRWLQQHEPEIRAMFTLSSEATP